MACVRVCGGVVALLNCTCVYVRVCVSAAAVRSREVTHGFVAGSFDASDCNITTVVMVRDVTSLNSTLLSPWVPRTTKPVVGFYCGSGMERGIKMCATKQGANSFLKT